MAYFSLFFVYYSLLYDFLFLSYNYLKVYVLRWHTLYLSHTGSLVIQVKSLEKYLWNL